MNLWLAISFILAVVTVYLFVIEVFSVAFKLTGLATSKIKFQVASLFTGTGYTTAESELIAKDEKRRKIARACIYTGHVFSVAFMGLIINVAISLFYAVRVDDWATPSFTEWYFIILYITLTLFILMLVLKIPAVNIKFQRFLETIAINASKKNKQTNIVNVIDIQSKHAISEVILNIIPDTMKEKPLSKIGLTRKYSIHILSIRRDSRIIEVTKDTMFRKGDVVTVYGLINEIREVFVGSIAGTKEIIELDKTNELTLVNNYGSIALVEVYVEDVPEDLRDVSLEDAHLKDKYNITVCFIERKDEYLTVNKDTVIQKGDKVSLFGPYHNIKMLFKNDDSEEN